jgi:disulfide bond formation protein DsbB
LFVVLICSGVVAAACGGGSATETTTTTAPTGGGVAASGEHLFEGTCQACHAEGGIGVEGLGKPLAGSDFVQGQSDAALIAFLKVGRSSANPDNTTGIDMPPKGGNPSLDDQDLADVVAYLRSLQ